MVTSRSTGTNPNVQTYHSVSGGDFDDLSTYESTIDEDQTAGGNATTETLEVMDGAHDDTVVILGGIYDATYPLIIRAQAGAQIRSSRTSGARFESTSATQIFNIIADYVYVQDLGFKSTTNSASSYSMVRIAAADNCEIVGCHIYDSTNSGAGAISGIELDTAVTGNLVIQNIIADIELNGILFAATNNSNSFLNNTISGCTTGMNINDSDAILKNNIGDGNTTDFTGSVHGDSTNNISSDGTAPGLSPLTSSNVTFVSATDFHLDPGSVDGPEDGADLSSDFDDDIDGNTRTVPWSAGAHELNAVSGLLAGSQMLMGVGR